MTTPEPSKATPSWRTIESRAERAPAGYPLATIAFYGPDDRVATKVAVALIPVEDGEVEDLERWYAHTGDVRDNDGAASVILRFLEVKGVRSIVMVDSIIGCPHEEGVDYPTGANCLECPYWHERDRWSGLPIEEMPRHAPVPARSSYVTDLWHFLDDDGRLPESLPEPALNLALHQGAIVEWMTAVLLEDIEVTNVACRRRPRRRRCRGRIVARFKPDGAAIEWRCPACGDNGIIYGWAGTPWDRSEPLPHGEDALPN